MPGNDGYTKLLIHSNTTDGSVTFVDSATAKVITVAGQTHHEIDQYKFGTTSIYFDGAGDDLNLLDHADWYFAGGDFTIDFWIRFNSLAASQMLISQYQAAGERWNLFFDSVLGITFVVRTGAANIVFSQQGNVIGWAIDTWYHVAVVRNGDVWRIYRNGTYLVTTSDVDAVPNYTGLLYIGQMGGGTNYFAGYLDEIRISKGIARWTNNFSDIPIGIYNKLAKISGYAGSGKICGSTVVAKCNGYG